MQRRAMDIRITRHIGYLGQYLRPFKGILVLSFCLSILSTVLGMIQPYFAKLLIDRIFVGGNTRLLAPLLLWLVILLIIGFSVRVGNNYIYTRYSARLLFRMRTDLFAHLHRVPLQFFTRSRIGDIYSRIAQDMAEVQGLVTDTAPSYLFNFLTCLITAAILIWLNWKMALMSFAFLPISLFVIQRLRPRLVELSRQVTERNADISHFLLESLGSATLVRAFGAEDHETGKLQRKQSRVLALLLKYQVLGAVSGSLHTIFTIINTLVVFGYGGSLVLAGELTIGSLVAFSIYQGRVFGPLQGLLDGFLAMQKSKVALARVREILDIEAGPRESGKRVVSGADFKGEIVFENVSFAYEADEPVLRDLNFRIPAGRVTALIGPSGAGKSTLCHLILRLFNPSAGRITLDGIDLRALDNQWLKKQIAMVSQDTFLFHTSIMENIRYARPTATDAEVVAAARAACIHEFVEGLPEGYATLVGDRGVRLSGGQKQRISIARALLLGPRILILDEATAFLDTSVESRLQETLNVLMAGKTILVISHRMSTLRGADKVVVVSAAGRVVADGSPDRLSNPGRDAAVLQKRGRLRPAGILPEAAAGRR